MTRHANAWRWLARKFADQASRTIPSRQEAWAIAMRNELDYMANDREALAWAAGSLRASLTERLRAVQMPDTRALRLLLILPLMLLLLGDTFASVLTAAYRLGSLDLARMLGKVTPGDDYTRLIPLMEGLPLWLHALEISAGLLYAFTIIRLLGSWRVSWIPVALAIGLELAADVFGRPIIDAIGVRANPDSSWAALVLPKLVPGLLALYLWRMKPAAQS